MFGQRWILVGTLCSASLYTICADFNEDGFVNASDLACWAGYSGVSCLNGCP